MKKLKEKTIKTKEFQRGKSTYVVEIYETEYKTVTGKVTEFWIYNEDYGIKSMMFGVPQANMTDKEIMEFIDSNIEDYIRYYKADYEDNKNN